MHKPKPLDSLASVLHELITHGQVASSRLSGKLRSKCQPLIDGSILKEEKSGAGRSVRVANADSLIAFAHKIYPSGLFGENSLEKSRRGQSLEQYRDTKSISGLGFELFVYRHLAGNLSVGDAELSSLNAPHGLGSAVLHDDRKTYPWPEFSGHIATVENPTVLLGFPWKDHNVDLAILTSGRMSNRMISWLACDAMARSTITHFGDYDPVGLSEFDRLYATLGNRVNLYIPDNLELLFRRYGSPSLQAKSANLLHQLSKSKHPDILLVLELSRKYGGLEQEALLLEV